MSINIEDCFYNNYDIYKKLIDLKTSINENKKYDSYFINRPRKNKENDQHYFLKIYEENMKDISDNDIIKDQSKYLDLCSAPGGFIKYISNNVKQSSITGITLPVSEGGQHFSYNYHDDKNNNNNNNNNVKVIYKNIHKYILPSELKYTYDVVICGGTFLNKGHLNKEECDILRKRLLMKQLIIAEIAAKMNGSHIILKMHDKINEYNFNIMKYLIDNYQCVIARKPNNNSYKSFYFLICKNKKKNAKKLRSYFRGKYNHINSEYYISKISSILQNIWEKQYTELANLKKIWDCELKECQ